MSGQYRDAREAFWRRHYELGQDYDTYLAGSNPVHAGKWRTMSDQISPLTLEEVARVQFHRRRLHVLVYTGVWCGDCVRQGPMIQRIAEAAADVEVRWIDRDVSAELQEELRMMGALRVPVVVFLSEDFWEIGRYGDRTLSAYRAKGPREGGPGCGAWVVRQRQNQLLAEQAEWVDAFERALLMARLSPPLRERHGD